MLLRILPCRGMTNENDSITGEDTIMTTREKALVIAMTGVLAWGASSAVLGVVKQQDGSSGQGEHYEELLGFAERQRALLDHLRLAGRERMVLDEAVSSWADSPFLDEPSRARALEERVQTFRYTGHVSVGNERLAILNGREYRIADPVRATDFIVESIYPDRVVLAPESGGRRMTIDLANSQMERNTP
jgi:hypothetical protein